MSDNQTVTEREVVLRERKAFLQGIRSTSFLMVTDDSYWSDEAVRRYPLPLITRPRVVKDPEAGFDQRWRVVDGCLEYAVPNGPWHKAHKRSNWSGVEQPTPARIRLWADLLHNPTEEVTE